MGPATASPFFFLLVLAILAAGGCLIVLRLAIAGYVVMGVGVGLFALHRLMVHIERSGNRPDD